MFLGLMLLDITSHRSDIFLYCLTESGSTVRVDVKNFYPYIYVEVKGEIAEKQTTGNKQ